MLVWESNLKKHGLDFRDAHLVYDNPDKCTYASSRSGESRWRVQPPPCHIRGAPDSAPSALQRAAMIIGERLWQIGLTARIDRRHKTESPLQAGCTSRASDTAGTQTSCA